MLMTAKDGQFRALPGLSRMKCGQLLLILPLDTVIAEFAPFPWLYPHIYYFEPV